MACIVLGIGVFALVDGKALSDLVSSGSNSGVNINIYTTAAILLIVVSAFVIIVTFFGCCGAIKENRCMLGTYFAIILSMFIIMIIGAVIGYSQSLEDLKQPLLDSMKKYDPSSTDKTKISVTKSWDQVQHDFICCGVSNYDDWEIQQVDYLVAEDIKVPLSCCDNRAPDIPEDQMTQCTQTPTGYSEKLQGCFTKIKESIDKNANLVLAVAVTIVIIMFLNMIFAFAMCTMAT